MDELEETTPNPERRDDGMSSLSMKSARFDLNLIAKGLSSLGLSVSFVAFGSRSDGTSKPGSDFDVAVIADDEVAVQSALRDLARTAPRRLNWTIQIFDRTDVSFGYNSRHGGELHLVVVTRDEMEGSSPLARSIRRGSTVSV